MRRYLLPLLLLPLLASAAPAAAAKKVRKGPSGTAFYTPPSTLPGSKHGDAIWARKLRGAAALKSAKSNRLLLYRSVGADGKAAAVSGTVSIPKGKAPRKGWPVISYAHGTTGIADKCAPSRDGAADSNDYAYRLLNRWLKAGYAVVRTDYQGLGTPPVHLYLNGVEEGRATLDIVRAARKLDKRVDAKRVAIAGHSQGGHAALWAAALAPSWTPELKLRGTVAFAPASHLGEQAALLPQLRSPGGGLSGLAALILRSEDTRTPQLGVAAGLSAPAAALYPQTLTACLGELAAPESFGGMAPADLVRPDYDTVPLIAAIGTSDPEVLRIRTPVRIEQGTADTTVFPNFTEQLRDEYRDRGNPVTYKAYPNVSHGGVVDSAAADSLTRLRKWLKR